MAIIHQHDKRTGHTYVYESTSWWDKEKQQSRAKRKLIGKLDPETGEIVPTRGQLKRQKEQEEQNNRRTMFESLIKEFKRFDFGACYTLRTIAKEMGLIDDLKAIFPSNYKEILSLAIYLVLAPSNSMMHFEEWQKTHFSYAKPLTSQRISDLFHSITEDHKQRFFQKNVQRYGEKEYWAYDTTSISSYSDLLTKVQYGFNKEGDRLPQLNLAMLLGEKSRIPFAYRILNGNVPDVKTIPWLMNQLEDMAVGQPQLVLDRGHYSFDNVMMLLKQQITFILGGRLNVKYVQEAMNELEDGWKNFQNYDVSHDVYGTQIKLTQTFKASDTSYYPVYLHLFYDQSRAAEESLRFDKLLQRYYHELQHDQWQDSHEKAYRTYFDIKGKHVQGINNDAIQKKKDQLGYFVLLTNEKMSSHELLSIYRNKDVIEKAFEDIKGRLNMRRLRVSSDRSLEGKIFVQFIALMLVSRVKRLMEEAELFNDYNMEQVFNKLNQIECYINDEDEMFYSEVLSETDKLLNALKVTLPPR